MSPAEAAALAAARGPFAGDERHLDAPYRPTPRPLVEAMLDLAGTGPGDRLVDLGCGDGRIVIAAARRGAEALGIERDSARLDAAAAAARRAGLAERARFERGDLFLADLADASIVALFLLPHVNGLLAPKLRHELRPGARIVGHSFPLPGWTPAAQAEFRRTPLYLWIR